MLIENAAYHITSRGIDGAPLYKQNLDRLVFLSLLRSTWNRLNWRVIAYCLMSNHYHLLVQTPDMNISRGMRWLNGMYARRFNRRHKRTGHLFESRFFSRIIRDEAHMRDTVRYIFLNPVRAGLADLPWTYRWSSCINCLGSEKLSYAICDNTSLIREFGISVEAGGNNLRKILLSDPELDGTPHISGRNTGGIGIPSIGKAKRRRPDLDEIFSNAGKLSPAERDEAIRRACLVFNYPQNRVAGILGLSGASVSRILRGVQGGRA